MPSILEVLLRGIADDAATIEIIQAIICIAGKYATCKYFISETQDFLSSSRKLIRRKREKSIDIDVNEIDVIEKLMTSSLLVNAIETCTLYSESIKNNKRMRLISSGN
jgi:predicted HAD superfamily hydrolase